MRQAAIRLGAVALFAGALAFAVRWRTVDDPAHTLMRALPRSGREIQPRLSGGLPWARLRATPLALKEKLNLFSAVSRVLQRAEHGSSARHASALAQMVGGDARAALATLETLRSTTSDARTWNDIAAAQYVLAIREDEPERFAHALVAVDAALRIDSHHAEARFNRALILERLGTRDLARREWETYLHLDPDSAWAGEARHHRNALAPIEPFEKALQRDYARLASDASAAHTFARRYRQMARTWGETEILGDWGRAAAAGDEVAAAKHLAVARGLAAELARDRGNQTFLGLVAAIDGAKVGDRRMLARAHVHLSDGRRAFRERRFSVARQLYATAAEEFSGGGSVAGALRARLYCANMAFEQGRLADAQRDELRLLASIPRHYAAYRAETLWMLGAIAQSEGRFGDCLDFFGQSLALFEQLAEDNYAAAVRGQMVFAFDRVGDPRAWKNRMIMLRELGRQVTSQQTEALGSVTRAALMEQNWEMALSFLQLEIDVARRVRAAVLIQSLLYRAETYGRTQEIGAAMRDLADARRRLASAEPGAGRERLEAIADAVEGSLTRDPAVAVPLLSRAIAFQLTKGRRAELPESLRKRAHAYRAAGDLARAAADLELAVAEIETHRGCLPAGEGRWGVFHAADELFRDAIDLALARGDARMAFAYAERARARTLLETVGVPWDRVSLEKIPPRTAIVGYTTHRDGFSIFVADRSGIRGFRRPGSRAELVSAAAKFRKSGAASTAADGWRAGRELYRRLIEPIESELRGADSLVFVTDPVLGSLPFAALVDRNGKYLVESAAISVAPSAAFYLHARDAIATSAARSVVVVSGATARDRLPGVAMEARAVWRAYPRATLLEAQDATPDAFLRAATAATAVHFGGHAISDDGASLLLGGSDDSSRRLDQTRIAQMRLPRTDVVVLAACATANGELRATEGTISVARAFLAAGVPSVIATLWPIEDRASAKFFPLLHRQLASGSTPAEAVRAAQLEWIRRQRSPAMWAAVQVIGR